MLTFHSVKILAVDCSYSDTGWCLLECKGSEINIRFGNIPNESMTQGFQSLCKGAKRMNSTMNELWNLCGRNKPDIELYEMPSFSQSAKAALAIGLVWGSISGLLSKPNAITIEPSHLKKWSGSKRGDGKKKVYEKVISCIGEEMINTKNDNIIDAIGTALMFLEIYKKKQYEAKASK